MDAKEAQEQLGELVSQGREALDTMKQASADFKAKTVALEAETTAKIEELTTAKSAAVRADLESKLAERIAKQRAEEPEALRLGDVLMARAVALYSKEGAEARFGDALPKAMERLNNISGKATPFLSSDITLPTSLVAEIIQLGRQESVVPGLCRQRSFGLRDGKTLTFNRRTAYSAWGMVAENGTITDVKPSFEPVTMTARKGATIVYLTTETLEDASPDQEAELRMDLAGGAGGLMDLQTLTGSGVAPNVKGILSYTAGDGINILNASGELFDDLIKAWKTGAKAAMSLGFMPSVIASADAIAQLMYAKDANGQYRWAEPITGIGTPGAIGRLPNVGNVYHDENIATASGKTKIVIGDFRRATFAMKREMTLTATGTSETAFTQDLVGFRATVRFDFLLENPNTFVVIQNVPVA